MLYRKLGRTDIEVSALSLGTMTWGEQNTEREAHAQLERALQAGINFIDTAEMYPVPPRAETQGRTELMLGNWLARSGRRDEVVLATKVSGPASWVSYLREGEIRLDRRNIEAALDSSLKRLQTDYVDLYQVHWPDRPTNYFGALGYEHREEEESIAIEETLEVMDDLVRSGKVRTIGVSNETPWGVMRWLQLAEQQQRARVVSIQNPYNLLNRSFEVGLAEIAHREHTGLLAYSPLAFGVLSGKYLDNRQPEGTRLTLFERFSRYSNSEGQAATRTYVDIARRHGLDPAQMALAFVTSRPFVTSTILGATTLEQLQSDMDSIHVSLSTEVLEEIEREHGRCANPCP